MSVHVEIPADHDVSRVAGEHLSQYVLGSDTGVVVDDQETRLRGLGELRELRKLAILGAAARPIMGSRSRRCSG
jgi:hypothetical protein